MTSEESRQAILEVARNYEALAEYVDKLRNVTPRGAASDSMIVRQCD
jgi:hypothetical protein